ncbi:MAG: ornithine cyclodeaminase [Bacteroides sp.]|nr:ornithine cyclodeaminase [Bacteroides sp.]
MRIITDSDIKSLNISPRQCVEWVQEAFKIKDRCKLPPKISIHPTGSDFINTMPCLLPEEYGRFGCKIISRIEGAEPTLKSELLLLDSKSGEILAMVNCDWITAMRTGAVATLAIKTFRAIGSSVYAFVGLGVMGRSTLECLLSVSGDETVIIRLKRYKDHAEKIIEDFGPRFPSVRFEIADSMEELVEGADVIVSCITYTGELLVENVDLFKPGVLVVPVHTRGFQNCDTVFDKVFADDTGHVKDFKYFNQFRKFGELSDVIQGMNQGRETNDERILSYNIGLGLHDVFFATKIVELLHSKA